jgi:ComF family protein
MSSIPYYIKRTVSDLGSLIYPRKCYACGLNLCDCEEYICLNCQCSLPRTNFYREKDNPVSKIFWGRVKLFRACSFLYFHKGGSLQTLIHKLKYEGKSEIGVELGRMFGGELYKNSDYATVDMIVPVPLHYKKEKLRGYNQSTMISNGISEIISANVAESCIIRPDKGETQTNKARYERWENVRSAFVLNEPDIVRGKHILLVDDVVTTGSTIEACANAILSEKGSMVSVATIAMA